MHGYLDCDFEANARKITADVDTVLFELCTGRYDRVVVPGDGIGTGVARLDRDAPRTYQFLLKELARLQSPVVGHRPKSLGVIRRRGGRVALLAIRLHGTDVQILTESLGGTCGFPSTVVRVESLSGYRAQLVFYLQAQFVATTFSALRHSVARAN